MRHGSLALASQRSHRRRADAVAAHVHLLGFGERLAVGAVVDGVVGRKALGLVQLGRFQNPQADVDDHVRRAFHHHVEQGQRSLSWCNSGVLGYALLIPKPLRLRLDTSDVRFQCFVLNLSVQSVMDFAVAGRADGAYVTWMI